MLTEPTAYPLSWPLGHRRTPSHDREQARFAGTDKNKARRKLTVAEGLARVRAELDRYTRPGQPYRVPLDLVVISTDVPLRLDGKPRSGLAEPADPGVVVYFLLDSKPYCLPCDTYTRVADNLAAIAATIDSSRTIERHGVLTLHNLYADFKALPEQASPASGDAWWQVLGVQSDATPYEIRKAHQLASRRAHPDVAGGSHEWMTRLNTARDQGLQQNQRA